MRNFQGWLKTFRGSIATYSYYTDFDKVYRNVGSIKVELNILNSLVGSTNIELEFQQLTEKYPEVLKCIPILLAVRTREIYCQDSKINHNFIFDSSSDYGANKEKYIYFMKQTGLFELMQKHIISNLVDYVTGVETGLDSNGRKNRGGDIMEDLVETFIQQSGFIKDRDYFKEMSVSQITDRWHIDLSAISNNGKAEKRFDFVIKTDRCIFGVEANFYNSQGSKLNETARSYKTLANEITTISGFEFMWITDGMGWQYAQNNLEETFDVMEHLYNITDLECGIISEVCK